MRNVYRDIAANVLTVECPNCGSYKISRDAFDDFPAEFRRRRSPLPAKYLISGILRDNNERGLATPLLTIESSIRLVDPGRVPHGVMEQLEHYLQYVARHTEYLGELVMVGSEEFAIAFARNPIEMASLTNGLVELGWVTTRVVSNTQFEVVATIAGLEHASKTASASGMSEKAFVAMWFTLEMDDIYEHHIVPAVERAGYRPLVIRAKEHNNDVNAEIVAEIQQSRFIVADFTGQRGGVYFEAGYALGLRKPVIWTCNNDWFNKVVETKKDVKVGGETVSAVLTEERRTHFDVEHFSFILWTDGAELEEKLYNRIRPTIPQA